ncbi:UDP-2,3-diacylglucosamine diphosphatase [Candidatus Fukatsuia symbiotica]|uniref:UDP-2,3-diacylglucosamine hydrolase n=1 Tax=Candidatus Fukatsuia symbiotica TaxID=1878942 RepID=A0A2U8I2R2_9GAMM|nr:UDP-2,3-diacylglucosamine diphosphatase [Candidatus Fukatsuia symbiotica]AWK13406.1 UDP-2,3-diacylglucosamine diphosphatase [Candidatus Fukatsuia symbiotica]MEA9444298.1 UDP-2,3-diacylglucosamine diphosphatase [Candidatus Fukatsuia symbiotica]
MKTLFIADLHLSVQQPAITAGFMRFLQSEAIYADSLYILGDLFEAWIGDDDPNPLYRQVASALGSLQQQGIPCYFIHGNRDFLLGKDFAKESGMTLLAQEKVVTLYGRKILLLHGDTLCTDDIDYQRFRRKVQSPLIQKLFLWLPLGIRLHIAAKLRQHSQQSNTGKSETIMDVNQQAVIDTLQRNHVDWMIHGHTHRPAIHSVELPKTDLSTTNLPKMVAHRAVLGAWHEQGSMIEVTAETVELIPFPL